MEQASTLEQGSPTADVADLAEDDFTKVAKAGWNGFTRFLLLNVVVTAAALIIIGIFTVWS
jgi:hypothetical protein